MGLLVRIVPPGIGSAEKVFFRGAVGFVALLALLRLTRTMPPRPADVRGLVRRGVLGGAALLLFFHAIDTIGLTRATLYCYTYPVFAALFAWAEMGERPSRRAAWAVVLAVAGAALTVDRTDWGRGLALGDLAGIASGVFSGAAMASVRKLRRTERSAWIVLYFSAISALMAAPLMLASFRVPGVRAAALMAAIGLLALAAQMLMTRGYRDVPAAAGGVLSLMVVPLSAALALAFLGERQPPRFWVGAALVLGAALVIGLPPRARPGARE
jgi:drug/metabolite transporter (DMT)-like permease